METLIISGEDKKSILLLNQLAEKLGLKSRKLSNEQSEDILLAELIDEGMDTEDVDRDLIMRALGK